MQNFKVDLTTRLASNLINDQLGKKKGTEVVNHLQMRNTMQKSGARTANATGASITQMKQPMSK